MPEKSLVVRDLMTSEIVTIGMDDTLRSAQQVFNEKKFHHLIVVEGDKPVGVISDRDLLKHLSPFIGTKFSERPQDKETLQKRVHQMMTRRLISIAPNASAADAARFFVRYNLSCLPVIEPPGRLVGIITSRDLLRWVLRHHVQLVTSS